MIAVTNEKAAGAAGLHWAAGEVKEVEDALAHELVSIKDSGFKIVNQAEGAVKAEVEKVEEDLKSEVDPAATNAEVDPAVKAPAKTTK